MKETFERLLMSVQSAASPKHSGNRPGHTRIQKEYKDYDSNYRQRFPKWKSLVSNSFIKTYTCFTNMRNQQKM